MRWSSRHRAAGRDSGASAVEFALVVPVLLLLVFGMLEFAFVMRDYLSVSSAVRVGARVASTAAGAGPCVGGPPTCVPGSVPALAQAAADAIQQAGTAMPQSLIDNIWIYKANSSGFPGSATTQAAATCSTDCVVFRWNDAIPPNGRFVYQSGTWLSSSINACVNSPNAQSVGVMMRATHPFLTGFFGSTITLRDRAVMKFEPLSTRICAANQHP